MGVPSLLKEDTGMARMARNHINEDMFMCNCVISCPEQALVLEEIRPLEHIRVK